MKSRRKINDETKSKSNLSHMPINSSIPPVKENFEKYFEEFYKNFNHCKYNLVALNKKFETLERFFKKFILEQFGKTSHDPNEKNENSESLSDYYTKPTITKNTNNEPKRRSAKKYSAHVQEEDQENFAISPEDLEYLKNNFITDGSSKKSKINLIKKNLKTQYDVIVINKNKMTVDEYFSDDKEKVEDNKNKNNSGEAENMHTVNNFNEKLFDYKNFSKENNQISNTNTSIKKDCNLNNSNNINNTLNITSPVSNSQKWLSKNESKDSQDILLSNEALDKIIIDHLPLSLADNPPIDNVNSIQNDNSTKKKQNKISEFIKIHKESLNKNENSVSSNGQKTSISERIKYELELRDENYDEKVLNEKEFYNLRNTNKNERILRKKLKRKNLSSSKCTKCRKNIDNLDNEEENSILCQICKDKLKKIDETP